MERFKRLVQAFIILIVMAAGIYLVSPVIAEQAKDAHLVKIMPNFKTALENETIGFHLDPSVLNIKKNSLVVWMNGVEGKELQVVFEDGKTCKDVTADPKLIRDMPGFFLDSRGCYSTTYLPYSATTTLQFIQSGKYDYMVQTEDGKMTVKGKIEVHD